MYLGFKSLQIYKRLVYICYTKHLPMKTKLLIYKIVGKAIPYLYLIIAIYSFFSFIFIAISNSEYWAIIAGIFLIFLIFSLFAFMAIKNILTIDVLMHTKEERERNLKVIADNYIKPFQKQNDEMFEKHRQQMEDLKQVRQKCLSTIDKYLRFREYKRMPYIVGNLSKEDAELIIEKCRILIEMKADGINITEIPLTMDVVDFVKSLKYGITRGQGSNWTLTFKEEISL
jgi:hypothetical protein